MGVETCDFKGPEDTELFPFPKTEGPAQLLFILWTASIKEKVKDAHSTHGNFVLTSFSLTYLFVFHIFKTSHASAIKRNILETISWPEALRAPFW